MKRLLLLLIICISSFSFGQFNCADTTLVRLTSINSNTIIDITSPILFTDSGGENGNYSSSENYEINFNSGSSTNTIVVNINETDFEHSHYNAYDYLKIYTSTDGVNWTKYNGFTTIPSQNYDKVPDNIGNGVLPFTLDLGTQYIKFTFYSDASITKPGWKIILTPQNSSTSLGSETMTECNSYTWNTNGQTYTQSGQYTEVLTNQSGCDSTVTLNLTITNSNTGSETMTECNSYTWNTNGQTYTQTGQYTTVLTNAQGCDSTVTLDLTINSSSSSTQTQTGIDSYTWSVNNETYTESGTYTAVITNAAGCDSTITLDLTLEFVGLNENESSYVAVYPNPTYNSFTLSTKDMINMNFMLVDIQGKVVLTGKIESSEETVDISKLSKGQYNLVFEDESVSPISIIKN